MKLNKKYKIEKAVSTDTTQYVLNNPHLERTGTGKGVLIATDGRRLAVVPVELDVADRTGSVPLDAIKELVKDKYGRSVLIVNGKAELIRNDGSKAEYPRAEGTFPDWKRVIPTGKVDFEVTFNPQMLLDIARAIGVGKGEGVTLRLRKDGLQPIEVTHDGEAHGVIMPMKK